MEWKRRAATRLKGLAVTQECTVPPTHPPAKMPARLARPISVWRITGLQPEAADALQALAVGSPIKGWEGGREARRHERTRAVGDGKCKKSSCWIRGCRVLLSHKHTFSTTTRPSTTSAVAFLPPTLHRIVIIILTIPIILRGLELALLSKLSSTTYTTSCSLAPLPCAETRRSA